MRTEGWASGEQRCLSGPSEPAHHVWHAVGFLKIGIISLLPPLSPGMYGMLAALIIRSHDEMAVDSFSHCQMLLMFSYPWTYILEYHSMIERSNLGKSVGR